MLSNEFHRIMIVFLGVCFFQFVSVGIASEGMGNRKSPPDGRPFDPAAGPRPDLAIRHVIDGYQYVQTSVSESRAIYEDARGALSESIATVRSSGDSELLEDMESLEALLDQTLLAIRGAEAALHSAREAVASLIRHLEEGSQALSASRPPRLTAATIVEQLDLVRDASFASAFTLLEPAGLMPGTVSKIRAELNTLSGPQWDSVRSAMTTAERLVNSAKELALGYPSLINDQLELIIEDAANIPPPPTLDDEGCTYVYNDEMEGWYLFGSSGNDDCSGSEGNHIFKMYEGDDIARGKGGHDEIHSGSGADTAWGGYGFDVIFGNRGNDTVYGGPDGDKIVSGPGHDYVNAGENADEARLGSGNDVGIGNSGPDYGFGGTGDDGFDGEGSNDGFQDAQGYPDYDNFEGGSGEDWADTQDYDNLDGLLMQTGNDHCPWRDDGDFLDMDGGEENDPIYQNCRIG